MDNNSNKNTDRIKSKNKGRSRIKNKDMDKSGSSSRKKSRYTAEDNRKYIEEKFGSDGIKAPESLSEENMLKMLEAFEDSKAGKTEPAVNMIISEGGQAAYDRKEKNVTFELPGGTEEDPEKASGADEGRADAGTGAVTGNAAGRQTVRKAPARPAFKKVISIAASVLAAFIGISGIFAAYNMAPDTSLKSGELYSFKSEREIRNTVRSFDSSSPLGFLRAGNSLESISADGSEMDTEGSEADSFAEESVTEGSASDANTLSAMEAPESSEAGGESHSSTYLQVDEVDEADIVKTDGSYIYYVNSKEEVVILSAKNGKTEKVSTIGSGSLENYIHDIYLKGDTLITTGRFYDDDDEGKSGIVVYDISDRSDPKLVYDFSQTGDILTSRMVGDCVYLVTCDYIYNGGRILPSCGSSDNYGSLQASDIYSLPDPGSCSYVILSAIDISSGEQSKSRTKAVFGATDEIYCSDHSLYTASTEWDEKSDSEYTRIVKASLDGLDISFEATTAVRGYIQSQFAMDEHDGYFRIATTSMRDGIDVNNLYVLDSDLRECGKVTGFARNESIKAVRFIGSKAYVITYEAIDPLFIIDLADPENPRIEGEVKIDGFSTLLIPISGSRLLGIGHATGDNGYGGEYDSGLKLALFDISDPSEPKVLDSKEFSEMSSQAQSDHHALTVNTEEGYFAIPYDIWHYADDDSGEIIEELPEISEEDESVQAEDEAGAGDDSANDGDAAEDYSEEADDEAEAGISGRDYHEAGVLVFKASDRISSVDQHRLGDETLYRSVYIGEWIYALDADGEVYSFRPKA